jgi:hypothetical protein
MMVHFQNKYRFVVMLTITSVSCWSVAAEQQSNSKAMDPVTSAILLKVGLPIASNLFDRVLKTVTGQKPIAAQSQPLLSGQTEQVLVNSAGSLVRTAMSTGCYAYLSQQANENNTVQEIMLQQLGVLGCQTLSPVTLETGLIQSNTMTGFQQTYSQVPQYIQGTAEQPLAMEFGYGANYQGLSIQIDMLDGRNQLIGIRSAQSVFKTGERFRLRLKPTFSGLLELTNVAPNGNQERIFPQAPITAFQLNAGQEMTIPANPKQFFYFDEHQGNEQLVIRFADPAAFNNTVVPLPIYRNDKGHVTYLMQQASNTQRPLIVQAIGIRHE